MAEAHDVLPGGWRLERLDPGAVAAHEAWNGLVLRAQGSVVQRAEFVFSAAQVFGSSGLRLATLRRGAQPVAMAIVGGSRLLPELFVASQMPLGAWVQAPGEDFVALARSLLARLPLALQLGVPQLDERFVPPPADGTRLPWIRTPWLALEGDFASYWSARGRNLRTNLRKQGERLAAQGAALRVERLCDPAEIAQGVADYALLESRGWKAGGGTAVMPGQAQARFYAAMLERFALIGAAEIWRAFIGERLVACELCLRDRGEFVILKTTYDETLAPLSPAALMRREMFERLFADGDVRRVEFYGPLKEWHTRWSHEVRELYHVNLPAGPVAAVLLRSLRAALSAADGVRARARA
jgi:hypothetical protein